MIAAPELVVQATLQTGFQGFVNDSTDLQEIFSGSGRSAAEINDIVTYFTENIPPVLFGFPKMPPAGFGAIAVSLTSDKEDAARQFIGSDPPIDLDLGATPLVGTISRAAVKITVLSIDYLKAAYLSILVKWILLGNRLQMEENFGLMEQVISMTDILPDPRFAQDFVFRRDMLMETTKIDVVELENPAFDLEHITAQPEVSIDPSFEFTEP